MFKLLAWTKLYLETKDGATAIEYGLIVALISLFIVGGATLFGEQLDAMFRTMAAVLTDAAESAGTGSETEG